MDCKFVLKKGITLIPRPETEELVNLAIEKLKLSKKPYRKLQVLDIGTGSGCIAISIAKALDFVEVTAWDISEEALKIAQINALLNKTKVKFENQNVLEYSTNKTSVFDMIISNPPYVTQAEKSKMEKNVLDFEPHLALFVEDNEPLLFYNKIAEIASQILQKNGILLFEINENFGKETELAIKNRGFINTAILKDIHDKERMLIGQKL